MFVHTIIAIIATAWVLHGLWHRLWRRCFKRQHPRKIILDTDIGDDIDDALAVLLLLLLHATGVVEVVAIITSGQYNHQNRARLVSALARAVLVTVPILAGRQHRGKPSKCNYMTAYPIMHAEENFPVLGEKERAWLLDIIADEHDKGHKVTFLCIGLLGNLKYISPPADSVSLCLMGGCFGIFFDGQQVDPVAFPEGFAEYNVVHSVKYWQWAVRTFTDVSVSYTHLTLPTKA